MNRLLVRNCLVALMILLITTGLCGFVYAAQLRLAWDANTEADLTGYKFYYGTASRSYGVPINVGKVTTYTLSGLTGGQRYYVALTAYDTTNNESSQSSEVSGVATEPTQTVIVTVGSNPAGREILIDGTPYSATQTFSWVVGTSHAVSVNSSPQNGSAGIRYAYSSWSDGGTQTHAITVPSSNTTYTANFTTQYTLSTSVSPAGSGSINPAGANWYNGGQSVSLSATASTGYTFSNWSGSLTHSTNPTSITMDGPKNVTANFSQNQYTLTVNINPSNSGSVTKSPNKSAYLHGEQVTLSASANSGYVFNSWSGSATGSSNPVALTMNGNKAVTGNFSSASENVTTPSGPTGPGNGNTGISYSYSTGGSSSNIGHSVEYQFDWKGDGSDLSSWGPAIRSKIWAVAATYMVRSMARCAVCTTVHSSWSGSLTVNISPTPGFLTVTPGSGGSGSGTQGGPFSPSSFTYTLQNAGGTAFNWNASATQNWISLSSSSGSLSPGASTAVTVSINQNANSLQTGTYSDTLVLNNTTNHNGDATRLINLTVNGSTLTFRIGTSPSGLGVKVDGVIFKTPQKITWPVGSTHSLAVDSPQNWTNRKRYIFSSWSDGGSQSHPVTASSTTTSYTANFSTEYSLTTSVNMKGAGAVTPLGTDWYDEDQVVTVSAQPNFDYSFTSWTNKAGGVISKTNPLVVTMSQPKNLKANFRRNTYALVAQISPRLGGSLTRSPKKLKYFYGDQVTLTAKANPGYTFSGWSGDAGGTQSTITITMDADKSIGVEFSGSAPDPQVLGKSMKASDDLPLIGELESPSGGKNMSGVKPIYGWALDKEGIAKIELFVDGSYVCQIPYGGLREDLREAHPRYPKADQSGFALIWNYSVLTPGDHTVEVRIHNEEGQTLDLATTVNVVKFHGDGITLVTPEIFSSYPVSVTADGVTKSYDVNIQWFDETQDFGITEIIPRE